MEDDERAGLPKQYYWGKNPSKIVEHYYHYSATVRRSKMRGYSGARGLTAEQIRFRKFVTFLRLARIAAVSVFVVLLIYVLR
ncbi:MAG: hypothetical protein QW767_03260 [Thermoprotei archaeon]